MKLLYDILSAQTACADRGIGRYSLDLGLAMQAELEKQGGKLRALAYDFMPGRILSLRRNFGYGNVDIIHFHKKDAWERLKAPWARTAACLVEDVYRNTDADAMYVSMPIESPPDLMGLPMDYQKTGKFTAGTFYDLVPLLFPEHYNCDEGYRKSLERTKTLDLLLAISENTRQDLIEHLGIAPERVVNIGSGVSHIFKEKEIQDREVILERYGVHRDFVMYTGGSDWRKNQDGLIRAWACLPETLRKEHQLVIVCAIDEGSKKKHLQLAQSLGLRPDGVRFTGFVSDDDLVALYNLAELFKFPSLYEGFGLPIVEAMRCGTPVIGSDNSSIKEIIQQPEALFNPQDEHDMARVLEHALRDADFRRNLKSWGKKRATDFTWERSAQTALEAVQEGLQRRGKVRGAAVCQSLASTETADTAEEKKKIAWVSPMPPAQSGIALYSEEILPYICKYFQVDVYTKMDQADRMVESPFDLYDWTELPAKADQYELIVYQMGNSDFHDYMLYLMECCPGLVY